MLRKVLTAAACLILILSASSFGLGDCPGTSKGSSGKEGGVKMMVFDKGSVTILKETGSIIVTDDKGLKVEMAGPEETRTGKYKDVDLQKGDRIIMLNGKRINTVQEFEDGYRAVEIGSDIELGVKRDNIMMIVSFPRAAEDDLPMMQAMMITEDDQGISSIETAGDETGIKKISAEDLTAIKPVPGAGLVVAEKEGDVTVMMVLPNAKELMKENRLEEGDIIISLQGDEISTSKQFAGEYDEIPVGSKVSINYVRDGETGTATFTKQESSGAMELKIER